MAYPPNSSVDHRAAAPTHYGAKLLLFVIRRMALAGVNDAHAANAMLGAFGRSYRRPLVLTRATMLEIARTSARKIMVAPCCCARLTADEAGMMQAASLALTSPEQAYRIIADLTGGDHGLGAFTCLQAVAQAYSDLGRPLDLYAG
jgi:hypothetical protein